MAGSRIGRIGPEESGRRNLIEEECMALVKLFDDKSASPEAREVFEDIRKTRNTDIYEAKSRCRNVK